MWFKRLLLVIVTLAIIVAFYFLYISLFSVQTVNEETVEPVKLPEYTTTTVPAQKPVSMFRPEEAILESPGEKAYFERYSNNRLLYQFRSDHWKPTGKQGTFDLSKPELRIFLKRGQILHVSAEEGQIEAKRSRGSRLDPTRGVLTGRVHIFIDRATDPHRIRPELRQDDIIHIWLDEVTFDLELNRIESKGAIQVESSEMDLTGTGLRLSWNDLTNQIDELIIRSGDKLVLYRGGDIVNLEVPGVQGEEKTGTSEKKGLFGRLMGIPAKMQTMREKAVAGPATHPTTTTSAPAAKQRSRTYELDFASDVKINQYDKVKLTGTMTCDKLKVIFDLPRSTEREDGSSGRQSAGAATKPALKKDGNRIEIFWKGPLDMKPVRLPYSPERRFHIIALGQPVLVDQMGRGKARCKKMTYHEEAKKLWLEGTTDDPVSLTQGKDLKIVGARLFYDRNKNIASGSGPGFMQQVTGKKNDTLQDNVVNLMGFGSKRGQMRVLWKDGFKLKFGTHEKITPEGRRRKQYLKEAEFKGAVEMQSPNEFMSGDFIALKFQKPGPGGNSREAINTLHAERNVILRSDQQSISCDLLDVKFAEGKKGRVPRIAKAKGNVKAKEKNRIISADKLDAVMEDVIVKSKKEGSKPRIRIVLREVQADGNVTIRDPDQPVNVDCLRMDAKIEPDGTLRFCHLEGTPNNWAKAVLQDFSLAGAEITMDLKTEQIEIPVPGELQFVNRQDIDGRELSSPVPIAINWSGFMKLTGGEKNQGTFVGKTKVKSKRTTLYSEKLVVDFEEMEQGKKKSGKKDTFWIFSRLLGKKREQSPTLKLPVTKKRPSYIQAIPEKGKRVYVQNIERENGRLISRTTLRGNELSIDFISHRLNVPGAGDLTIEDYHLPKKLKQQESTVSGSLLKDPFGSDVRSGGPSQTVFTWKTGLLYLLDRKIAIFDGSIKMIHRAGLDVLAEQLSKPELKGKGKMRKADLTCENLKVEFLRGAFGSSGGINAGAAELKKVIATGSVHMREYPRSIIARSLMYDRSENIIVVEGKESDPAYLYEESDENVTTYSGPLIVWDRQTDEIRAPGAVITTTVR